MTPGAPALVRVARRALDAMDLEARVAAALPRGLADPYVVAIGKAAPAMAKGALARYPGAGYLVVAPDETDARGLTVLRAAHPLPDRRSVRAAEACLAAARAHEGTLVVLVSGGASSLVCAPSRGVTLADKRAVTRAMLRSGASIRDVNVVRKHLSRIKGGALARDARAGRLVTLVASDVIGGRASDVGSGPSVGDTSTVAEARRLVRRFAPDHATLPLVPTWRSPATRGRARARIVASPEELARAVARDLGARVLSPSQAPVDELAREYVLRARRMRPGSVVVRAAEPSLAVPESAGAGARAGARARAAVGSGGRSTHLAALVGRDLPRGAVFVALATDGVDGTSGTAGAAVDARFAARAGARLDDALARFDTGSLHVVVGTALPFGPTGHNLADLHILAMRPS